MFRFLVKNNFLYMYQYLCIDTVVCRDPCIPSDLGEGRGGVQSCTYLAVIKITMSEIKL